MIPPQLAIFAAKHSKKLLIALAVGILIAGVWFAVKMHERTVEKLAQSEAARAAQVVAHETTLASLQVQKQVAAEWKASAEKYQRTLDEQERVKELASAEGQRISQTLRDHDLEQLTRKKPELLERIVNRATARMLGLLNCSSTPSGCDGDRGTSRPDSPAPVSPAPGAGDVQLDRHGTRTLARSGSSLLLPGTSRLRSSGS